MSGARDDQELFVSMNDRIIWDVRPGKDKSVEDALNTAIALAISDRSNPGRKPYVHAVVDATGMVVLHTVPSVPSARSDVDNGHHFVHARVTGVDDEVRVASRILELFGFGPRDALYKVLADPWSEQPFVIERDDDGIVTITSGERTEQLIPEPPLEDI